MTSTSEDSRHGQILSTGARVWAHFSDNEYYRGVISKIKDATIRVDFDDGYVMFYKNGHLGEVLLDRKAVPSELGIGVEVIIKAIKKNVMYKGVIHVVSRGLFHVKFNDKSQNCIRKRASSLVVVENYEIEESEPTEEETHVMESSSEETRVMESSAEETRVTESSAEETRVVESSAEVTRVMESSAEETRVIESSAEETRVMESSSKETRVMESSSEVIHVMESSAEETRVVESSAEETRVVESSAEETRVMESSAEETRVMESSAEETHVMEISAEETDAMEISAEETKLMKSSFEAPVFLLDIPPNSLEQRDLPNPMSPEVLWSQLDLIGLQLMVKNCASRVFDYPCAASLQQQQQQQLSQQPAVAELTVGALFDPIRKPLSASHTPEQINPVICACQTTDSSGPCNGHTDHQSLYCRTSTPGSIGRHSIVFPAMSTIYSS